MSRKESRNARLVQKWNYLGFAAGAGLLAFLMFFSDASWQGFLDALARTSFPFLMLLALFQGLIITLAAMKWRIVIAQTSSAEKNVPLGPAISATATGVLIGQVISIQVGVPVARIWVAKKFGLNAKAATGSSLYEQALDLLTLVFAALASILATFLNASILLLSLLACLLMPVAVLTLPIISAPCTALLNRFDPPPYLDGVRRIVVESLSAIARQDTGALMWLAALSLVRYILITIVNVWIVVSLLPEVDWLTLTSSIPLILLAMSLPFLPAGLGLTEITLGGILVLQGVDPARAVEVALAARVVLISGFILSYPFLILMGQDFSSRK
ncbi:lysylphosphatidylglycerol synthase transmembrane domain-containing protein [Silicimonas sp. MF1-12-2]|uniref:lysylphosphatidylglycerol synthase transmembrane domain-containing protein n=1 Tax=Silicimonas sp. MF1-12-2 TaxID=3384793 RepID=UPI0039B6689C